MPTLIAHANDFVWAKGFGGSSGASSGGDAIAVDGSGNVYTTGDFGGTFDFDPGAGTFDLTSAGNRDIFVSKLDSNGDFVWAKRVGGSENGFGRSIALDGSNNVYITGSFRGTVDFDPGVGVANLTSAGNEDIFVLKLTSAGALVWARQMRGTAANEGGRGIAVDGSGVYTTGSFAGTSDFDPGVGTENLTSVGLVDTFVSKLDSNGVFVWAVNFGGNDFDFESGHAIALDSSSNVYTTGRFEGLSDFDPDSVGVFNLTSAGSSDIFVSKLTSGGAFVWAKKMGGTGLDIGDGIVVDGSGNVHTTGEFRGTADFDPGAGTENLTSAGSSDVFVSKLNSSGALVWAKQMGGAEGDQGQDIALDSSGNVFTTGIFEGLSDFDPGAGTFNLNIVGTDDDDIFISKLTSSGDFAWAAGMGHPDDEDKGNGIAVNGASIHITGDFDGTVDFDPGSGTENLSSAPVGSRNAFVLKLSDVLTVTATSLEASYQAGPSSLTVDFSAPVANPGGSGGQDDVTNPANYLLVEDGDNGVFDTNSCLGGRQDDDTQFAPSSVTYNSGTSVATVNLSGNLPKGNYRLFICGTTSIISEAGGIALAGDFLNIGTDYTFDFSVEGESAVADPLTLPSTLPETGFSPGRVTALPKQPASKAYNNVAMTLEIPTLNVSMPIVGVPVTNSEWDVTWLGENAGYLYGSAFPTWDGNTVLTGHVWDAWNQPGPFAKLNTLKHGDQFFIHAWGLTYTYEVRTQRLVTSGNMSVLEHKDYDWVTLLTCERFNESSGDYYFRRAVQAVLLSID